MTALPSLIMIENIATVPSALKCDLELLNCLLSPVRLKQ